MATGTLGTDGNNRDLFVRTSTAARLLVGFAAGQSRHPAWSGGHRGVYRRPGRNF
jgi:hypothetical protein